MLDFTGSPRPHMIKATCHTADEAYVLDVDALPWFREADLQSIVHVAHRGWSSEWLANALERRPGYERLHDAVDYAATRLREESLEDPGWVSLECVVDQAQAMAWLTQNRPDVAAAINASHPKPEPTSAV